MATIAPGTTAIFRTPRGRAESMTPFHLAFPARDFDLFSRNAFEFQGFRSLEQAFAR
jgi:extradiol dioxygenase family protein